MPQLSWQRLSGLDEAADFLARCTPADPFLHPVFLHALEDTGIVGPGRAWSASHLLLLRDGEPRGLLPLYEKQDSRGEYVFDHGWAAAYQRYGLPYYPKLVTAIPFTPVPGPRLLLAPGESAADWLPLLLRGLPELCRQAGCSGWHGLFMEDEWVTAGHNAGMAIRLGCRFHWENPGFSTFDDFLDTLTSKKRKDIRRERRLLAEAGIRCHRLAGRDITLADWDFFHDCYARTYREHGQLPYLNRAFFRQLAERMPERLLLVVAEDTDGPLASALFFRGEQALYGRYWGCLRRASGLHFEVCYYQGMEHCIEQGLRDFDPGTQGEHKLLRGFAPRLTHSLHWLAEEGFQEAVQRFVQEEGESVRRYANEATSLLPYRQGASGESGK